MFDVCYTDQEVLFYPVFNIHWLRPEKVLLGIGKLRSQQESNNFIQKISNRIATSEGTGMENFFIAKIWSL